MVFTFKYSKNNFLSNLKAKIKTKIIKIKRKHLLFKEAMCKNRISLIKLFVNRNLSLNFFLNILGDVNCRTLRGNRFRRHFHCKKDFLMKFSMGLWNSELVFILSKVITS